MAIPVSRPPPLKANGINMVVLAGTILTTVALPTTLEINRGKLVVIIAAEPVPAVRFSAVPIGCIFALTLMLPPDKVPLDGTVIPVTRKVTHAVDDVLRSPFQVMVVVLFAVVIVPLLSVGAGMPLVVNAAIPNVNVTPEGTLLNVKVKLASFVVNAVPGPPAAPEVRSSPAKFVLSLWYQAVLNPPCTVKLATDFGTFLLV